jgi:tetratricopeptide (TPR) repeat protein
MNSRDLAPRTIAVAVVLSFVAADAFADRPRHTRDRELDINVQQTEATEGLRERAERRRREEPQRQAAPEITADQFIHIEGQVRHIRDEQIENFRMLIEDTRDADPQKPDLLFRLAELYAQKQRYFRFRGMELHAQIDRAQGSQRQQLQRQQQRFLQESRQALVDSIQVYAQIARNPAFRNYERMDEALFFYAFTLQSADYMEQARTVYRQLIQQYPESRFVPFAYLAFADYFFEQEELARAEQFYDRVLEFPDSPVYAYAMYKKGWVFLNLARSQEALETFFQVARITEGSERHQTLNQNAKRDFVRAYADVGRARQAYEAFQRVDRSYAFTMLELLGDLYVDQGKAPEAIFTFRELMRIQHRNKKVCEWQYNVVRAILSDGTPRQKTDEVKRLVGLYTTLRGQGVLEGHYEQDCRDNAMATTSELARVWHNEAIRTLNMDTLAIVEELYELYLEAFRDAEDWAEMQYYHAELLWSRAENEQNERRATVLWENAAVAFTAVVQSGQVGEDIVRESAYASVLGWQNALAVDPRPSAVPTEEEDPSRYEEIPEPQEIDERNKKMLQAFDIYINYVDDPEDSDLVDMKFYKARIFWRFDHLDEANKLFIDILRNHRDHEVSLFSANLLLDSLNRLQRYDDMNVWVQRLLSWEQWLEDKEELHASLIRLQGQTMRRRAEQLEERGDHVACGELYREIYNMDPDTGDADELLYNSGTCYEQGKSIGLAIRMFETLSQRFPDSTLTQRAIVRLGVNYAAIAYYDQAAERFEVYARRFGGEDDAPDALNNAVLYRRGLGQDQQAIENVRFFIRQYGRQRPQQAADAMFTIAEIYEKRGEMDELVNHLQAYLRDWGRQGGPDRALIAHAKIGQVLWDQSCPVSGEMHSCVRIQRQRSLAHGRRGRSQAQTQCGPESAINLTVVDRDPRLVRDARRHFTQAINAWNDGRILENINEENEGRLQVRQANARYWYAAARFYMIEQDYEEYLSVEFPSGLDFDRRNARRAQQSEQRFNQWIQRKENLSGRTAQRYREIVDIRGAPQWAIAAAARIGQISQNFSDALFTAEIPRDVRTGPYAEDATIAYCDTLTTAAQPLEELSVQAFGFCLERSTQLSWSNEWSKMCERELGQIRPQDFPTASEIHAPPTGVAAITGVQAPILELR